MLTEIVHLAFDLLSLAAVIFAVSQVRRLQRALTAAAAAPPPPESRARCARERCESFADPRCMGGGCMSCCRVFCQPRCSLEFQRKVERLTQAAAHPDKRLN